MTEERDESTICAVCGQAAEKTVWATRPEGNGLLFVHRHEKWGQVLVAVGHFVPFDSDEYRAWEAKNGVAEYAGVRQDE